MPIRNVVLNVADVAQSVDFYTRFLTAKTVGQPTPNRASLDLVTATLELRQLSSDAALSTWIPDDLQKGRRHLVREQLRGSMSPDIDEARGQHRRANGCRHRGLGHRS
jgi:catechol 2,3-dioxygenase-like lactoylglutathione lyase family enzyme